MCVFCAKIGKHRCRRGGRSSADQKLFLIASGSVVSGSPTAPASLKKGRTRSLYSRLFQQFLSGAPGASITTCVWCRRRRCMLEGADRSRRRKTNGSNGSCRCVRCAHRAVDHALPWWAPVDLQARVTNAQIAPINPHPHEFRRE